MLIWRVLTLSLVKLSIKLKLKRVELILKPQDLCMPSQSEVSASVVGWFLDQLHEAAPVWLVPLENQLLPV